MTGPLRPSEAPREPPTGPEEYAELRLNVTPGAITATVLRFADHSARLRLATTGGAVGLVLDGEQVGALRAMLGDALGVMFTATRRPA